MAAYLPVTILHNLRNQMSNPDLKNVPLFVFVRQQGERIARYSRKVSDATGPYVRRVGRYWRNARLLSSVKQRFRAARDAGTVEAPVVDWNVPAPTPTASPDFMQAILQRSLPPRLHALLALRSAVRIACVATIDLKAEECVKYGWSADQISAVLDGASHPAFNAGENLLLQYADDITRTPIDVDLQVFRKLRHHFTEEQIAEATASICYENFRTRYNNAMGNANQLPHSEDVPSRANSNGQEAAFRPHLWQSVPR